MNDQEFDLKRLNALAAHSAEGRTLLETLVEDFLDNTHLAMTQMRASAKARDAEAISTLASALLGPSQTLGLNKFSRMCADLETVNAVTPDVVRQVEMLQHAYQRATEWLTRQGFSKAV